MTLLDGMFVAVRLMVESDRLIVKRFRKMKRLIENLLIVIGSTFAGLVFSALLAFVFSLRILPSDRDAGGAVVAFMILAAFGAVAGAITGLAGSIRWIIQRSDRPLPSMTWIGVPFGCAIGVGLLELPIFDSLIIVDLMSWLPAKLSFLTATSFVGGCLGAIGATWFAMREQGKSKTSANRASGHRPRL